MPIKVERKLFATGNSLAVTLPKTWIKHHHLRPGDRVKITAEDAVVIHPVEDERKKTSDKQVE